MDFKKYWYVVNFLFVHVWMLLLFSCTFYDIISFNFLHRRQRLKDSTAVRRDEFELENKCATAVDTLSTGLRTAIDQIWVRFGCYCCFVLDHFYLLVLCHY